MTALDLGAITYIFTFHHASVEERPACELRIMEAFCETSGRIDSKTFSKCIIAIKEQFRLNGH